MASSRARNYLTKSLFQTGVSCPRKLLYARQGRRRRTETNVLLKSLAAEGRQWEAYARLKRFPQAVLATTDSTIQFANIVASTNFEHAINAFSSLNVADAVVESQVRRTLELLFPKDGGPSGPIFEGVVRHNNYLIRADVLECIPYTKPDPSHMKGEILLTEIKTKSFNTASSKDPIWGSRGGIRSDILPYVQDVAFQTMVLSAVFPDYDIKAYLLMPDKAMMNSVPGLNQLVNLLSSPYKSKDPDTELRRQEAYSAIMNAKEDLSGLVDVTAAVDYILDEPLDYPGSTKKKSFQEVAEFWSQSMDTSGEELVLQAPLGTQCKDCEYRLEVANDANESENTEVKDVSGFHQCWAERTGLSPSTFREGTTVVDLWNGQKKDINELVARDKFLLSDLDNFDMNFTEDGRELNKKGKLVPDRGTGMSRSKRQFYQAIGVPHGEAFVAERDYIEAEMESWRYPFHFVDFETATPVIPYFAGMAPFDTIAFQYSHHIMYEDGTVRHVSEFLKAEPGVNPNGAFAEALAKSVGDCEGSVFRWGSHENTVLKSILEQFNEGDEVYQKLHRLLTGSDREMVDLHKIAKQGYFVAGSDGSSSVKKVLMPTLNAAKSLEQIYGEPSYNSKNFTNVQWFQRNEDGTVVDPYRILKEHDQGTGNVADGGAALSAYHILQSPNLEDDERLRIQSSLLRYCELDTLAMVMICQAWQEFFLSDR